MSGLDKESEVKVAVLFDGAGLARLGLEQAGHDCTGFEIDPDKHRLSMSVGSGCCELEDVTSVDLSQFDGVWASPPCQVYSRATTQGKPSSPYSDDLLSWCLRLPKLPLWVENVYNPAAVPWGTLWNAAQFSDCAHQNRVRVVGGRYKTPHSLRPYRRNFSDAMPTVMATEYKAACNDQRRASRAFGRRLSLEEVALYQGLQIPRTWYGEPTNLLYEAIGNGVPVYMARAFGEAYAFTSAEGG